MKVVLGMDAGTHGIRALAFDIEKRSVMHCLKENYERHCADGIQELNAYDLWEAFLKLQNSIINNLPEDVEIAGLGITHQRGTIIPVDRSLIPLSPAFCDSDNRSVGVEALSKYGISAGAYYKKSGCPFISFNGITKILWCRENMPDLYEKAYAWLSPQDYILSRLAGHVVISAGSVLRNGYYDIYGHKTAADLFSHNEKDFAFMAVEAVQTGEIAERAAKNIPGVSERLAGVELIAVPGDQPSAVVGSGCINDNEVALNTGTTFVASFYSDKIVLDDEGMATLEILPENKYALEFGTGAGGQFMDWLLRLMAGSIPNDRDKWREIDEMAGTVPAGAEGLVTVPLLWQVTSPDIQGRFTNLGAFHERKHFVKSVYESLAYEARISIEKVERIMGKTAGTIKVFGGMSSFGNFLKILAAVTGKRVVITKEQQASAYGAALITAAGLGYFDSIRHASDFADTMLTTYKPEDGDVLFYEKGFKEYLAVR